MARRRGAGVAVAGWGPDDRNTTAPASTTCPPADLLKELWEYGLFVNGHKTEVNAYVESLRKALLMTFEYDFNRPATQPTNSTFRLIGH